jgi:predicted acylesterase/phospholipase RssA
MTQTNDTSNLPQNIGLALSGGGYRAAGFHLGLLSYLNRVDLLKQVKMISTVSGGTFTGAKYTLSLVEGKSFQEFYQEYYAFLENTQLVKLALDRMSRNDCNIPSKRTDLITATAQVYAETFLKNSKGQPYRFGNILNANIPLQEVIFNATEFRTGIAFRFQYCANQKGKIGNGNISIDRSDAADIRIADIVAASSCFPGGFEPLAFPQDFNWSDLNIFENVKKKIRETLPQDIEASIDAENYDNYVQNDNNQSSTSSKDRIALMDGGIYDNQGIESLWLADKRNNFLLDLFIISDVDQRPANLYSLPRFLKISNLTLQTLDWLSKTLIIFCFLTLVTVGYEVFKDYINSQFIWLDFFLYIVPLLLAAGISFIIIWGRNIINNKILPKIPQVGRLAWDDLKTLTINQVVNGIYLRLSSLQAMAGSVFMKRIRNMGFNFIYQQYKDKNREKLISNLIYELKTGSSLTQLPGVQPPSAELLKVIDAAANMPTTLWLTKDNQLNNLIISGQATTCYNLMVYIIRKYEDNPSSYPNEVRLFWDKLVADWNNLCSNPQVLP